MFSLIHGGRCDENAVRSAGGGADGAVVGEVDEAFGCEAGKGASRGLFAESAAVEAVEGVWAAVGAEPSDGVEEAAVGAVAVGGGVGQARPVLSDADVASATGRGFRLAEVGQELLAAAAGVVFDVAEHGVDAGGIKVAQLFVDLGAEGDVGAVDAGAQIGDVGDVATGHVVEDAAVGEAFECVVGRLEAQAGVACDALSSMLT